MGEDDLQQARRRVLHNKLRRYALGEKDVLATTDNEAPISKGTTATSTQHHPDKRARTAARSGDMFVLPPKSDASEAMQESPKEEASDADDDVIRLLHYHHQDQDKPKICKS